LIKLKEALFGQSTFGQSSNRAVRSCIGSS